MTPKNVILTRLLEKYEKSKHLTEPCVSKRRVMLQTKNKKKDLPEYLYGEADIRDSYGQAAVELGEQGFISIEWRNTKVFEVLVLNLERVYDSYHYLRRLHPKEQAEQVCEQLEKQLVHITTGWIQRWRDTTLAEARERYKIPAYCKEDIEILKDLLKALVVYDALAGESITMRGFSIKAYNDSKYFEREIRTIFLSIAVKYDTELTEICEHEHLNERGQLAYLGIYARPELYELAGRIDIHTDKGKISLDAVDPFGTALPSTLVDSIVGFDVSLIESIVLIENKTNYDEYLLTEKSPNELIFYHGGFLSPQKKRLLVKLQESVPADVKVYFWADIDLGGFQMFTQLQTILPQLLPLRMSGAEVERYAEKGLQRSEEYLTHLRDAMEQGKYPLFQDAIEQILRYGVTIEQEIMLGEAVALQGV